jgi:hypothetical protein
MSQLECDSCHGHGKQGLEVVGGGGVEQSLEAGLEHGEAPRRAALAGWTGRIAGEGGEGGDSGGSTGRPVQRRRGSDQARRRPVRCRTARCPGDHTRRAAVSGQAQRVAVWPVWHRRGASGQAQRAPNLSCGAVAREICGRRVHLYLYISYIDNTH